MEFLLYILVALVLFAVVFGPKSLLRFYLYTKRMRKLYLKYVQRGFDNFSALKEISRIRHPELSDAVHEKLASKFDELGALINFIYWGIEGHLLTKQELTDENALELIHAGNVVQEGYKYRVNVDKNVLHYRRSPVNSKSEQIKKIWYAQLRKSKEFPQEIAKKFFIADNIDPLKFKENHDYYIMDRYGEHKPTPSCFDPIDKPMGFPYWFASAYPDVVKYFSTLKEEEVIRLFENMGFTKENLEDFDNPKFIDQKEHCFKVEILYKLKEYYKKLYPNKKLECQ